VVPISDGGRRVGRGDGEAAREGAAVTSKRVVEGFTKPIAKRVGINKARDEPYRRGSRILRYVEENFLPWLRSQTTRRTYSFLCVTTSSVTIFGAEQDGRQ